VKVILDTNVFVSGIFFTGPPFQILNAWRDDIVELVVSLEVLEEYRAVGDRLSAHYPGVSIEPVFALLMAHVNIVRTPPLRKPVCEGPDDDKFLACALAAKCKLIVSGDKQLLRGSGYRRIKVLTPARAVIRDQ
jgi:putative PIN family toxin of toxin-antitoxin system